MTQKQKVETESVFSASQHPFYGDESYQTVWDTLYSADEVYNHLILPIEHSIARQAKYIVYSRTGRNETMDVWRDIFQETCRILMVTMCKKYKQLPKPGGVDAIPNAHIARAIIDATRLVIGGANRSFQTSMEFSTALTQTNGNRRRMWTPGEDVDSHESMLESLFNELEMNGIIPAGEFTIEDLEAASEIRSPKVAKKRAGTKAAELWVRLASSDAETLKEILRDSLYERHKDSALEVFNDSEEG